MKEFKKFVQRGNVIDLAVGVIMGAAFGKIVSSLVEDVLMPIFGIIIGGIDFTNFVVKIGSATIRYGLFIQNIINFVIIAYCIFIIVKFINKLTNKKEDKKPPCEEVILLKEIRDLLKKEKNK